MQGTPPARGGGSSVHSVGQLWFWALVTSSPYCRDLGWGNLNQFGTWVFHGVWSLIRLELYKQVATFPEIIFMRDKTQYIRNWWSAQGGAHTRWCCIVPKKSESIFSLWLRMWTDPNSKPTKQTKSRQLSLRFRQFRTVAGSSKSLHLHQQQLR